jgi:hypothetical protein
VRSARAPWHLVSIVGIAIALSLGLGACGPHPRTTATGDGGACADCACTPGTRSCRGQDVLACDPDGAGSTVVDTCGGSDVCSDGACQGACAAAEGSHSYVGCEYYPVDLDNAIELLGVPGALGCAGFNLQAKVLTNQRACYKASAPLPQLQVAGLCDPPDDRCPSGYACTALPQVCALDAQHAPFAVVVANPQATAVDVTLTSAAAVTATRTVAPGAVLALFPQQLGMADQSIDGSGAGQHAYQLTSTAPIVAYQFNPLDNVGVFSNDASLLIPRATFDLDYYAMTWPTLDRRSNPGWSAHDYRGYVTVVAWRDGTEVEVTPTVAIRASVTQPAIAAGQTVHATLRALEVWNLEAEAGGDLTGTRVRGTNGTRFGVYAGHEATIIAPPTAPNPDYPTGPCCADHLEEMMFPTSTWGQGFAVAKSQARGVGEHDVVRVLAARAGTTVTFAPAPIVGSCATLAAGAWCQVEISDDTRITTSQPALVGHYLQSTIWRADGGGGAIGTGDPSLSLVVPTEQYRTDYAFLVPSQYAANFVAIIAPAGAAVTLDGAAVAGMIPFGAGLAAIRAPLTAGEHRLQCAPACGIEVYGWDDAVSYMFAGGADLKPIVR